MSPSILAIGIAVPKKPIAQADIAEFMSEAHGLNSLESRKLKVLYRATGIQYRHSVIGDYSRSNRKDWSFYPKDKDAVDFPSTAKRAEAYKREAFPLSKQAIEECFSNCEIGPDKISHIITVSCTGMYAPGLDIDVVNYFGMNRTINRCAINFMGCYAGITAIKQAHSICLADANANVLILCVELCTLHFQNGKSEENLLANALFSDGAAALIMSSEIKENGIALVPTQFHCDILPDGKNEMAWQIGDNGFQMKLSSYVPDLIGKGIENLIQKLTCNLVDFPTHFAIHPGGKKILEVIEKKLDLTKEQNFAAYHVLKNYGNMSSPTVFFVLKHLLENLTESDKGDTIMALAFGPGLTLESMVLKVS